MMWRLGPSFVSPRRWHRCHGPTGGSHPSDVVPWSRRRVPQSWGGAWSHQRVARAWRGTMVATVGPMSLTWRHGPKMWVLTGGSHRHDVAPWSNWWVPPCWRGDRIPLAVPDLLAWSRQWTPYLMWSSGPNLRSHSMTFQWSRQWTPYLMWSLFYLAKNMLHGGLDPKTCCYTQKWVTTRPITHLCCSLVCCFICLVIKPNSLLCFPKN